MFLHKRKSTGYWYLFYRDETGKQRSVSTKQKKKPDALKFLREFREAEQGKKRRLENISLKQFIKEYEQYSKSYHTPNSHASAKAALNEFLKIVGDVPLKSISIRNIENFIAIKCSVSAHTGRRVYVTVSAALHKAVDWEYIQNNPFQKVAKPKPPEKEPLFFTKEDYGKLIKVIDSVDWLHFVTAAVSTGMRLSELINLQWEHVDLQKRIIHVANTDTFTTKSKKNRHIPINKILYDILTERKQSKVNGLVFHRRGKMLNRCYVSKRFKKYVIASGVNLKLNFHSLRHTCASWLVQANVPIRTVQAILGHSSVSVTERYAHLSELQLSDAVETLNFKEVHNAA